jgi:hypothetical protein
VGEVEVRETLWWGGWLGLGIVCGGRRVGLTKVCCFAAYVVAVLGPFDVDFGACSEFGGEVFEGYCCEAEGAEERGEGEGGEFHSCGWLVLSCECWKLGRFLSLTLGCVQLEMLNVLMHRLKHGGDYLYSKYNPVAYDTAYYYILV